MPVAAPSPTTRLRRSFAAWSPVAAGALVLIALVAAPPPRGAMLLVPTTTAAAAALPRVALASGARLLAHGPVQGSLVVQADRAALLAPAAGAMILLLAAPDAGCGVQRTSGGPRRWTA